MPTIADAIRHGQREIRRQEGATFARLLTEYENVWWHVEGTIRRYESQIAAAVASGEAVNPAWLRRQTWYRQLQESIDAELVRFGQQALGTIHTSQAAAVGIAAESTSMFAGAVNISPGIVGRVNPGAMERWVSALRPNSPLRGVVNGYGDRIKDSLVRHMSDGLGSGEGVSTILRRIRRDVGPTAIDGRLQTFTRSELMRSYRGASREQLTDIGNQIPGTHVWRWRSAKSTRTCLSCIAYDNRTFPFNQYPDRFHPACRCVVSLEVDRSVVPPTGRPRESGAEWFARQPETDQRKMMPTAGHYELFREGVPLADMVTVRRSRVWGESLAIRPLRDLGRR